VPLISGLAVIALLLASVVMFVSLINRVALLQISRTLAFTGDQGRQVIDAIYPELSQPLPEDGVRPETPVASAFPQIVTHHGPPMAVEGLRIAQLVEVATAAHAVVEITVAVGDTVGEFTPVARVNGARGPVDERLIRRCMILGLERTFEQDPKYAVRLLVDIAIRALSPAINDPTTAAQALDQIGDLLQRLGRRRLELGAFRDAAGRLRVTMPFPTWEDLLRLAFDEISTYGASSVQVMRRMHALVADLMVALPRERRDGLRRWRERLRQRVDSHFDDAEERAVALIEDRQGLGTSRPRRDAADRASRTPVPLDASPSSR
jgi:uncharacterized membrane protein